MIILYLGIGVLSFRMNLDFHSVMRFAFSWPLGVFDRFSRAFILQMIKQCPPSEEFQFLLACGYLLTHLWCFSNFRGFGQIQPWVAPAGASFN